MEWMDPENRDDDDRHEIGILIDHFEILLNHAGFQLRSFVKIKYAVHEQCSIIIGEKKFPIPQK